MSKKALQKDPAAVLTYAVLQDLPPYGFISVRFMSVFIFYLLSFTWGLPVTLAGCFAALFVRLCGVKAERTGYCFCYRIGHNWGGFSLGIFTFVCKEATEKTLWHEHGHGLQNCIFGPFMPFAVSIPSAMRYWYRRLKKNKTLLKPYESAWFEAQATRMGLYQRSRLSFSKKNT